MWDSGTVRKELGWKKSDPRCDGRMGGSLGGFSKAEASMMAKGTKGLRNRKGEERGGEQTPRRTGATLN